MRSLIEDLRYALRGMRRRPVFAVVAAGSLALGIAVNATVFGWIDRILLRPLPGVQNASQMVAIKTLAQNGDLLASSYLDFEDFRSQAKTLSGAIAFKPRPLYLGTQPSVERVWSEMVSGNFFDLLGVTPLLGRTFAQEEQGSRPAPVAVISERLWQRRFRRDPHVLGSTIQLNQQAFTVIGIVPAKFAGTINGLSFDLWVPLNTMPQLTGSWNWLEDRNSRPLAIMGRLAAGANLRDAQTELRVIAQRLAAEYPDSNRRLGAAVLPQADSPDGVQRILGKLLIFLLAIGAVVLLIVCANVGNLLLARAVGRQREFGIRLSLGASRRRLLQQLFTEALLLALAGAGAGLLLASWVSRSIELFVPATDLPFANLPGNSQMNGVLFTLGLCIATTILCALAPGWQLLRRDAKDALSESGRSVSGSMRSRRTSGVLVICELSLALIAVTGAGLFVKSFRNAKNADPGFDPEHVLLVGLDLSQRHVSREQGIALLRRIEDRLRTVAGVQNVSVCEDVPLGFSGGSWEEVKVNGYTPAPGENMKLWRNVVSPGYLATLKIPLVAGRNFDDRDTRATKRVAIVNENFAKHFFKGTPVVGRRFIAWGDQEITIVGVARDSKYHTLAEEPMPYFYVPLAQFFGPDMGVGLEVRTAGRPELFAKTVVSTLQSIDPSLVIAGTAPFVSYMSAGYFAQKVGANLLTVLGALSLFLAILGLYGVMTYSTSQRNREIGIRIAIGARPAQVLGLVLREGLWLCVIGVAVGIVPAILLSGFARGVLYGVTSNDPTTYLAAIAVLASCAVLATFIPARRAAYLNPVEVLHWE